MPSPYPHARVFLRRLLWPTTSPRTADAFTVSVCAEPHTLLTPNGVNAPEIAPPLAANPYLERNHNSLGNRWCGARIGACGAITHKSPNDNVVLVSVNMVRPM